MPKLTVEEILADVIDAFKVRVPAINRMGRDFRHGGLKKGQTYTAHIAGIPGVTEYDENDGGYQHDAQSARGLLTDVPITVDQHKKVSLLWNHLDSITDKKQEYDKVVANAGYAIAKAVVMSIIAKVNRRTLTQQSIYSTVNSDYDAVEAIRSAMNLVGAAPTGRTGIVNTAVASSLGLDERVLSKDYRGEMHGSSALRVFSNLAGFEEVLEWPELPSNNGQAIAITATAATDLINLVGHPFKDGDRVYFPALTGGTGLTAGTTSYYVRDAAADTFKVSVTEGGAAVDIESNVSAGTVQLVENLTGVFFEPSALAVLAGIPDDFETVIGGDRAPEVSSIHTYTDPDTGLTLAAISERQQGTLRGFLHLTLVWGSAVGRQLPTNAAGALTDYAGHRLVSA
ncbi:MAG TPA: P22 phage major capsid protein family protein [Bacteroidia bacterium]|nr:P22 phage major capsid protein family protein [Bacteroidia bacterium]